MSDATPAVADEDAVGRSRRAALSTVDSEFGRTTDPVRMYMREMGTVELRPVKAKSKSPSASKTASSMIQAISACPGHRGRSAGADRPYRSGRDARGSNSSTASSTRMPRKKTAELPEPSDENRSPMKKTTRRRRRRSCRCGQQRQSGKNSRRKPLEHFGGSKPCTSRCSRRWKRAAARARHHLEQQEAITAEFMKGASVKQVEALCESLRSSVDEIRRFEREIMDVCEQKAKMSARSFIETFPAAKRSGLIGARNRRGSPTANALEPSSTPSSKSKSKLGEAAKGDDSGSKETRTSIKDGPMGRIKARAWPNAR